MQTQETEHSEDKASVQSSSGVDFYIWCLVGIEEWLHFVAIDPIEESSIGIRLNTLSHSEEDGVWKKEDQKCK